MYINGRSGSSVVITPACSPASQAQLSGWSIPNVTGAVVEFTTVTVQNGLNWAVKGEQKCHCGHEKQHGLSPDPKEEDPSRKGSWGCYVFGLSKVLCFTDFLFVFPFSLRFIDPPA